MCGLSHSGWGRFIGPDLATVTLVRDRKWLKHFILEPDVVLKSQDPIAVALFKKYKEVNMPNLSLTEPDAENLVQFLEARAGNTLNRLRRVIPRRKQIRQGQNKSKVF